MTRSNNLCFDGAFRSHRRSHRRCFSLSQAHRRGFSLSISLLPLLPPPQPSIFSLKSLSLSLSLYIYISRWIKIALRFVEKEVQESRQIVICQEAIKLDKNSFSKKGKTHRNECNQASYSIIDPNNILNSQKHLSTRKIQSIYRSKTHTLNKSNQFYISKTSQAKNVLTPLVN